ncbi:MAG: hypothetical protein ACI4OT_04705 [Bacilli bacterium]
MEKKTNLFDTLSNLVYLKTAINNIDDIMRCDLEVSGLLVTYHCVGRAFYVGKPNTEPVIDNIFVISKDNFDRICYREALDKGIILDNYSKRYILNNDLAIVSSVNAYSVYAKKSKNNRNFMSYGDYDYYVFKNNKYMFNYYDDFFTNIDTKEREDFIFNTIQTGIHETYKSNKDVINAHNRMKEIIEVCDGLENRIVETIKPLIEANIDDIKCKFYRIEGEVKDDLQVKKR